MKVISIVTVCYNSSLTLEDTFESISKVKDDSIEYIVIDGGSTDNTLEIINKYKSIIDIFVSEPDSGIYDAMNKGLNACSGKWVAFLNSDDYYCQKTFLNILHAFKSNKYDDFDVVYSNIYRLDENTRHPYKVSKPKSLHLIGRKMVLFHPSMFMKRDSYIMLGLFDLSYKYAADYSITLKAYKKKLKFLYLDVELTYFDTGGATGINIYKSWKEVKSIQIKSGRNVIFATFDYYVQVVKRQILMFTRERF
ncbi:MULTISPECIES: glycosyltransferase family 2 protein [unclassified Pseudoalteromonas]|uniref:glycosyltransferase family 2 protein n=1 Tax=unclassified Pseudoalteromonas TaxID=194690 RepID=UPI0004B3641A|nr:MULTISPECIES: glycosyltransferase family 2 protein [unclassified Pseudoalteromonas]